MATSGSIPTALVATLRPEQLVVQSYTGKTFPARAAFVVDADSEKMVASAKIWASRSRWNVTAPDPDVVELPNDPFTQLWIIRVEHRGEGGIAYKVVTEQGWLVDLREDEFMEAVFEDRVRAGVITGEYVWSKAGSQMRLIRVGSKKYKERLEAGKRSSKGKTAARLLVPDHVYQNKAGDLFVYRGRVTRTDEHRNKGKRMFAWEEAHRNSAGGIALHHEGKLLITQSTSVVEDLGPSTISRPKKWLYAADGHYEAITVRHLKWL